MGSAQKTDFLSLNKWISTDIPKREDFNYDNATIDNAIKEHTNDMSKHISQSERSVIRQERLKRNAVLIRALLSFLQEIRLPA